MAMLNRLIFSITSVALTLGVARVWAQRKRAALAAEDQGLPANYAELSPAQQKRAEKQRRKTVRKNHGAGKKQS
jgi:hypothetical protein